MSRRHFLRLALARRLAVAAALLWSWAAAAQAPAPPGGGFALPVACRLNADCWVVNYVDVDSGPQAQDFRCLSRTYDGHDGTDIAVRDLKAMARGVPVVAGAPGVVAFVRDGEPDGAFVRDGPAATAGRDCGNMVVVDYGGGWNAQFCHLKQGSLRVRAGERVEATAALGLVGMSGMTEFPHLHWIVRHGRVDLDPFTGRPAGGGCAAEAEARPLWHPAANIGYEPFSLYAAGFAAREPGTADIRNDAGGASVLPADSPAIGLWAAILGTRAGDTVTLRVVDPGGAVFLEARRTLTRTQALNIPFTARVRRGGAGWPAGSYRGTATLERTIDGHAVRQTRRTTVEVR